MIPKTFLLVNRTWRVEFAKLKRNVYGYTSPDDALIQINVNLKKSGKEELLMHAFFHELLHAVAGTAGYEDLNSDEQRIDTLSALLAQAFQTAEE